MARQSHKFQQNGSQRTDAERGLAQIMEAIGTFERAVKRCGQQKRTATLTLTIKFEGGRVAFCKTLSDMVHHGKHLVDHSDLEDSETDIHM